MRLNVAVCDDDVKSTDNLYNALLNYSIECNIDMNIDKYINPLHFLNLYSDNRQYDILFTAIEMKQMSGIESARRIKSTKNKHIAIIFIIKSGKYIEECFSVHPYQFIHKPFSQYNVYCIMNDLISEMNKNINFINITDNHGENITVNSNYVYYIESINSKTKDIAFFFKSKKIFSKGILSEIEASLPKPFFLRCCRSCIINISHVVCIKNDLIFFDNGDSVTASRRCKAQIKRRFVT